LNALLQWGQMMSCMAVTVCRVSLVGEHSGQHLHKARPQCPAQRGV
jgi:hypothetical protein